MFKVLTFQTKSKSDRIALRNQVTGLESASRRWICCRFQIQGLRSSRTRRESKWFDLSDSDRADLPIDPEMFGSGSGSVRFRTAQTAVVAT